MLIRMGLIGGVVGLFGMSKAGSFIMVMVALGLFSLSLAVMTPALNARLSRYGNGQQGALMGMNSAISSLGRVVGPLWAGYLYDLNYEWPFISGAVILAIGSLISYFKVKEVG
jgi:DHA1 family multidrug resistance protein-like MFS transporter